MSTKQSYLVYLYIIGLICFHKCANAILQEDFNKSLLKYNSRNKYGNIGEKVNMTIYPFTVIIYGGNFYQGIGALLSRKWVISIAYTCILLDADILSLRLGSNFHEAEGVYRRVKEVIPHPDYKWKWESDLMLFRMTEPVTYTSRIKPIPIAHQLPQENATMIFIHMVQSEVTDDLYAKNTTYMSYKTCCQYYTAKESFTNYSLCTEPDLSFRFYDSFGGPLIKNDTLVGLFSGTRVCEKSTNNVCKEVRLKYPNVFVDMTKFNNWINETIHEH